MKKLIAYSSVAHMGYVTMGIFTMNQQGIVAGPDEPTCHVWVHGAFSRLPAQPIEIKGADGVVDVPVLGLSIALSAAYRHILLLSGRACGRRVSAEPALQARKCAPCR